MKEKGRPGRRPLLLLRWAVARWRAAVATAMLAPLLAAGRWAAMFASLTMTTLG